MTTFIGALVLLVVLMAGLMVYAYTRREHEAERYRLSKHQRKLLENEPLSTQDGANIFLEQQQDYLGQILALAGLEARYREMRTQWIMWGVGGAVVLGAGALTVGPEFAIVGAIFGAAAGAVGFVQFLKLKVSQRQKKLTEQLPPVLETMVSSLKSGSPILEVFKTLSETAPEPIRGEFKRALVSLQLGKSFRDVLTEMCGRIRTPDFRLLTQAIFISQDVGGNLADVVATISEAIRERFKLRDYLNSLTAQGKMTALFIGSLPFVITGLIYAISPAYLTGFFNNFWARIVMGGMICWELIGFWILMKLTTFEV